MGLFILVVAVVGIVRMARTRGASPWLFGGVAVLGWLAGSVLGGRLLQAASVEDVRRTRLVLEAAAYLTPWVLLASVVLYVRFIPGRKRLQPEGRWSCVACGWLNADYALECEACHAPFHPGPRSLAGPAHDEPTISPVDERRGSSPSADLQTATPQLPLRRSRVINLVFISLGTAGIYIPFWYLRRRKRLDALHSPIKLGLRTPVALVGVYALALVMPYRSLSQEVMLVAAGVVNLSLAFKVRSMLTDHLDEKITAVLPHGASVRAQFTPSSVLTFFFSIYYLQYKINRFLDESALWESPVAAVVTSSASAPDVRT
ncbi:MAG TPA: hypothetical protein VFU28_12650 [Vicinamibacterales bacterium]|nr:hypothetical protein [Vicinamibacterales bacterium]